MSCSRDVTGCLVPVTSLGVFFYRDVTGCFFPRDVTGCVLPVTLGQALLAVSGGCAGGCGCWGVFRRPSES